MVLSLMFKSKGISFIGMSLMSKNIKMTPYWNEKFLRHRFTFQPMVNIFLRLVKEKLLGKLNSKEE